MEKVYMSLIKFLFSRNKKTSVLASQQYGKTEYVEPQEVSILASRKYVKGVEMSISKEEDYLKLVIEDYCTLNDYADKIEEIDKNGIDKLLNNSVLWNNGKQRVNKGIYFVFKHNGNLYNILINDDMIKIDERTRIGEEIADKVISFYKNDKYYRYFRCMHDKNGSSYDTMYYNSNGFEIKAL